MIVLPSQAVPEPTPLESLSASVSFSETPTNKARIQAAATAAGLSVAAYCRGVVRAAMT